MDALGHTSDAILICFELPPLLPPRWFPSLTSPCWLCSSSLYMDNLDLLNPETSQCNTCRGMCWWVVIHSYYVQASGVFFHWVSRPYCVVQFWLWPLEFLALYDHTCGPNQLLCISTEHCLCICMYFSGHCIFYYHFFIRLICICTCSVIVIAFIKGYLTWLLHLLLCPSRKCPRCSFAICDVSLGNK